MSTSPPMLLVDHGVSARNGAPAVRDLSGQWYATMGIERGDGVNLASTPESFAAIAAEEPWVYAVINRVASDAQSVPLYCWARKGADLVRPQDNPRDVRQAAIQDLLDNVNGQTMSGSDLKAWHVVSEYTYGEDYWLVVPGKLGIPAELHWLRPASVEPRRDPVSGDVIAYRYTGQSGSSVDYDPEQVIAYRTPNPQDPTRGLSFLKSVRYDVAVDRQAAMWTAYTLANWGMPAIAWVAPKGADIGPQDQSTIRRVLRSLRGPKAAGKSAVLPEGIEPKVLSLNPKDAEWLAARKQARMTIAAAAGVPLVLLGDDDKNTVYGNLRDAQRVYWRGTLIPKLDRWADWLTNGAPRSLLDWYGPDARERYVIAFDYSMVEALRPELTAEMNAWSAAQDRENITNNEYRAHFSIGGDVPWGNNPIRSTRLIQEPPDALPPGAPQVEVGTVSVVPVTPGAQAQPVAPAPASREAVKDWGDVAAAVKIPLSNEYPKGVLKWIKRATWSYNPAVPLTAIDMSQPPHDQDIISAQVAQLATGAPTDPVILLQTSDDPLLKPADGRHRIVAYGKTDRTTIPAYIASGLRKKDEDAWRAMYQAKYGTPDGPVAARENPIPRGLYRLEAVKAWTADTSSPLDPVADAIGVRLNPATRQALALGLSRRYSADQLWNGHAPHGFRGLKETRP